MTTASRLPLPLRAVRRWWTWVVAAVLLAAGLLGSGTVDLRDSQRTAIPFPSLVYTIESVSNGYEASILNLGITPVGAPQVPTPVDVDGDLLPDVLVAVNLVDVQGVSNPPSLGEIVAPNIEINRFPLELGTILLHAPNPPLQINIRVDINDLEGEEPPMHIRFGYDTGAGGTEGSMPGFFQATLRGLEEFYNPLEADISTKGALIAQSEDPVWYDGPLTVIGGFEQGDLKADLDLEFAPFPDTLGVTFAQDGDGAQIGYRHAREGDVDLTSNVALQNGNDHTSVDARIERLPHELDVDMADDPNGGGIDFTSRSDGRLADVDVLFRGPLLDDVFDAHLSIEELPDRMSASWSMPPDGSVDATFDSSGQGIGAIEALIANKAGEPTGLPPWVFTEQQALAVHHNAETEGLRVGGRLERIRSAQISSTPDGEVDADVNVGDGELPLELDGFLDLRADDLPLVDANAVISPLPSEIGVSIEPGEGTEADPMRILYETLESPDVDATVTVRDPDGVSSVCGDAGVICANLRMRHLPTLVETRIFDAVNEDKREAFIEVDADGVDKPDLFADVTLGPDVVPVDELGDLPLVVHAEVLGITEIARIRTVEGADDTLEEVSIHTCDFDYESDECLVGTEDRIGKLDFSVANFLPDERPADLPPAYAATKNFATIVARGRDGGDSVQFEATGRMHDLKEVTYVNNGAFGVRTGVGGGGELAAIIDIDDIRFEEADEPEDTIFYDLTGDVLISPLPDVMAFCYNASGQDLVDPTSAITTECQQANPFDPDGEDLDLSPLSVAYDGSEAFDVLVDAEVHELGVAGSDESDDRRIRGHLGVENIPEKIRAHILDPADVGGGPMLVTVDAPLADTANGQVNVEVGAQILSADLQCQDPRVPDADHEAICASGRIENLPTHVDLEYDPERESDNFVFDSSGPDPLDLKDLVVSSVKRDDEVDRAAVLVLEAQVLGLPQRLEGTLSLPAPEVEDGPVAIDLVATPPLAVIEGEARNFIAPDPIPDMPAQREGLPEPDDFATFIQRGDAFKATVKVTEIARVGFKNQVTGAGEKLDTSVINVGFGKDKNIRGYVDLNADGTEHLIGDVTLKDVPAGIQVCFRGPKSDDTLDLVPADGTETYCDVNPAGDPEEEYDEDNPHPQTTQGAFEARMEPIEEGLELDIDAFLRHATGGGADVIAGRVQVDNIPNVLAGTFGDGRADFGGFELDDTPDGIEQIGIHAASFDIRDDGWNTANRPYDPRFVGRPLFQYDIPTNQYALVRADDADFDLRAVLGSLDEDPGSAFHRIQLGDQPCTRPEPVDYDIGALPDYGPRPDFPHMPTDDGTEHTCIRVDFKPLGGSSVDPLDLSAVIEQGGTRIALRDAGLTDVPEFVQINLADVPDGGLQDADPPMRPHCVGTEEDQPENCVAPMARVDTPGNSELFGTVEIGSLGDIAALDAVAPREDLPAMDPPSSWGSETGVRARIGSFKESSAAKAGLRIPIPASFTLDQVQSFGISDQSNKENFYDASDLHFRYSMRNPDGSTVADLGRFSALVHSFVDTSQILISDDDPTLGFEVPGELGVNMYIRDYSGEGRQFFQIDGRNSAQDFDMRLRMLGGVSRDSIGRIDGQVRNVPALSPLTYSPSADPSFRLRAEIMGDGKNPPDPSSEEPEGGEPPKEQECSPLLCVKTQVRLKSVNAQFDFEPTEGQPANLLEAAIRTDGAKNGIELRGYQDINGGSGDGDGRFLAGAQLSVDPINIFFHAGIPFLGSLDFVMISKLDAAVSLGGEFEGFDDGVSNAWNGDNINDLWSDAIFGAAPQLTGAGTTSFMLKQNLLHLEAWNGSGDTSRIGPIDFFVEVMHGEAWALFVKLLGIDFLPPFSTLRIPMLNCGAGGLIPDGFNSIDVGSNGHKSVVAWPFFPFEIGGNLHFSGVLKPVLDLVGSLGGPFFCLVDTDQELMENGDGEKVHPADPLGATFTGSTVPAAVQNPDLMAPDVSDQPTPMGVDPFTLPAPPSASHAWCGVHTFSDFDIPAGRVLFVATEYNDRDIRGETDVADDEWPAACPDGAELNELQIIASGEMTVDGQLLGSGRSGLSTNASGNGGGGHGAVRPLLPDVGRGGDGGNSGSGGAPTGGDFFDPNDVVGGRAGRTVSGGGDPGDGGAVIRLVGDLLEVNGLVSTLGTGGSSAGNSGQCSDEGDPDDDEDDVPNTGLAGGGGGAGGGIVINVAELDNNGTIRANGGNAGAGSAGGGGGGGGGEIKVSASIRSGADPTANGGNGGNSLCSDDFDDGDDGQDGLVQIRLGAKSKVDISETGDDFGFWHSTADSQQLVLPWQAAAQPNPADDYHVVLCHTRLAPENVQEDTDLSSQLLSFSGGLGEPTLWEPFIFPGSFLPGEPCGEPIGAADPPVSGPAVLNRVQVDGTREEGTISANPAGNALVEGYHGFWTVLWKSDVAGNDCLDPNDMDDFPLNGEEFDIEHCSPEDAPVSPDVVLGVDNSKPNVHTISFNGTQVTDNEGNPENQPVDIANPGVQTAWIEDDNLSGIVATQCTHDAGTEDGLNDCATGEIITVQGADGTKSIGIRVTDAAGNTDLFSADVRLDATIPTSEGEIVGGTAPLGDNDWYLASPHFRLFDFDDFGGSGPAGPPYRYQFDEGDERPCENAGTEADPECDIDGSAGHELPGLGHHALRWTAIDAVGNQKPIEDEPTITVKIDDEPPISDILSVPAEPNGANGWYSGATWVSFGAFDQPGGSGFEPNLDEGETDTGGIFYEHNGVDQGEFDPLQPLRLDPGENEVCWFARDIAGHQESERCEIFFVDEDDPVATPVAAGGTTGDNGWYTAEPTLTATVADQGTDGSGVDDDLAPTGVLCAQRPLIDDVAPSGTCISVDGAPFLPIDPAEAAFVLGEGHHEVRIFSTDRAGRRSQIETLRNKVDLSNPISAARTITPQPSQGRWHRADATVVLRAADGDRHGAGVKEIRYQVTPGIANTCSPAGSGYTTYLEPFSLTQGLNTVRYWAVDSAGRTGPCTTLPIAVDLTDPVPVATQAIPSIWLRINLLGIIKLSPQTTDLRWTVEENLSGVVGDEVHVDVTVYDVLGNPVRRLDAGDHLVLPGQTLEGAVAWDGRAHNVLGLVPLGLYYYRATVTDAAGNQAMSGESHALVVVRLL